MVNWTSVFVLSLICHGGYSKPQNQNEGEPEQLRREIYDQNEGEPGKGQRHTCCEKLQLTTSLSTSPSEQKSRFEQIKKSPNK